jgi:hypothetical protein
MIPDRIILQEETRLYRGRVLLANVPTGYYDIKPAVDRARALPVPVYGADRRHIGYATLVFDNVSLTYGYLKADLTIDYACPERLDIENRILYARIAGRLDLKISTYLEIGDTPIVLNVFGIHLVPDKPKDNTIPPVGTLIL